MKLVRSSVPAALLCLALAGLLASNAPLAVIQGTTWFPIGPAPGDFSPWFPGGVSGRASAVAVNPANADEIWLGTAQGGVWRSTDGGVSWRAMSDQEASLAIGSLALAGCGVNGCTWVYAGTGENAIRRDTFYGQGLLVGGIDGPDVFWSQKTGTPYNFRRGNIFNVVLDTTTMDSSQVLYVTLSSGVTASATQSTVTAPEPSPGGYGIYKSSDNGNTWTALTVEGATGFRPTDLEMDPTDNLTLWAGFMGRGLYKSEDGGATWCPQNKGVPKPMGCPGTSNVLPNPTNLPFDHVEIAFAPSDPQTLYASFGHCPDRLLDNCKASVYRSGNGGNSWTLKYTGSSLDGDGCPSTYSRYTHALSVHPTQPDTVFYGGISLCKSTSGGAAPWVAADTNTFGSVTHSDHHAVLFHPVTTSRAYNTNDGGIATSTNTGSSWTPRNAGLQTFGFQSIASSPHTARVIGGAQDNWGQMWTGLAQWTALPCCGDGGFSIMDRDDVLKMYVTTNSGTAAVPKRSSNGGASFNDAINAGLSGTDPRSFYPPFIQDTTAPHPLYFGTNRLWRSNNDAGNWTAVSPPLGIALPSSKADEIVAGQDVISAIAVAPSNPSRVYIGFYSGKVYVTDAACAMPSCWDERSSGLPAAPITWIAVHPGDPDTAYATLGGFFSGIHVYKTTSAGTTGWSATAPHGDLNGVPANTIVVEPGAPQRLWLGTDIGVYKSTNGGGAWARFSEGLPNVPIFEISIDETRGRVFAGTHGRGAYLLTSPFLSNYEGWVGDSIWDIPVFGSGFLSNQSCTMKLLRQNGTVCASGTQDAIGGNIETDGDGVLVTDKGGFYIDQPVAWACLNGNCLGGATVAGCNQPGNPISTVVAICGPHVAFKNLTNCPPLSNPPSSFIALTGLGGFFTGAGAPLDPQEPLAAAGAFQVLPTLQVGDGSTESFCSVNVPVASGETPSQVLQTARDAVNADAACIAAGVSAAIVEGRTAFETEDLFPTPDLLGLLGPGMVGAQLVPSLRAGPGDATGLCFRMGKVGVPVTDQVRIMRLRFETSAGGAQGGEVTLTETTGLGRCQIRIPTSPGDTAEVIAQLVENAFQAPGIPGPNLFCPSSVNPRDVFRHGDSVVTVLADEIEFCSDDGGVGFTLAPEEICTADAHCDDGNPCTRNACDLNTGQCVSTPEPDGLPCDDGNACTNGITCQAGVCGVPVSCEDGNLCTDDVCDPATGRCLNPPVDCDDGDPCTQDSCDRATGACQRLPEEGAVCDDGNACTAQDVCTTDAAGDFGCRGVDLCDDGDPCTVDLCDPAVGFCSSQPVNCDDGNPCTVDRCAGGACSSVPTVGIACDDGDLCTIQETCQDVGAGDPVCVGTRLSCDDGDACTANACDPATGACTNPVLPLAIPANLRFLNAETFTWNATADATHWNSYRGTIPASLLGSRVPAGPVYDHRCLESADASGDGALISKDPTLPAVGTAFYYGRTGESGCGESGLAKDSDGTVVPVGAGAACPTPP